MYALLLLIALAAFCLWYGLSKLLLRMDSRKAEDKERKNDHGKQ